MAVLILSIFVLRVVLVMGDVQCDCSALTFIKQLVQQEMFERKLEISMLRDELRKNSPAPGLIKTDSSTGSAISTRVERLEQRFAEFENASDIGQKTGAENPVQSEKSANNDNDGKHLSFQTLVKHALKNEKLERINFIFQVQKQIETFKDIVSEFKTDTDIFVNEQTKKWSEDYEQSEKNISEQFSDFRESLQLSSQEHVRQMTAGISAIMDDVKQLEQNASKKMEIFRESVRNDLEEGNLRIQAVSNEIADNVTDIRENVRECITAIDLLKAGVNDIKTTVNSSEEKISQLHGQFEEHIKGAERRFSLVSRKVGTCHRADWEHHGEKCYHFATQPISWFDASEKCKELNGDLVEIESKEENDYITVHVKSKHKSVYWIGLHDIQKENSWQWTSARSTFKYEGFRNWAPSEPNDAGANEDCATILATGQWNDLSCVRMLPFICQKDPEL